MQTRQTGVIASLLLIIILVCAFAPGLVFAEKLEVKEGEEVVVVRTGEGFIVLG